MQTTQHGGNRNRAIAVLLKRQEDPGVDGEESHVTAEVVWGVMPFLAPKITAATEKEAVDQLRTALKHNEQRPLIFFDDLKEAEDARWRNMNACRLLSGPFSPATRDSITNALDVDADHNTREDREPCASYHEPDILEAFDKVANALSKVAAGSSGPLHLVPDFDYPKSGNRVYVPAHDPRYKSFKEINS